MARVSFCDMVGDDIRVQDVNCDGLDDLVCHSRTGQIYITESHIVSERKYCRITESHIVSERKYCRITESHIVSERKYRRITESHIVSERKYCRITEPRRQ